MALVRCSWCLILCVIGLVVGVPPGVASSIGARAPGSSDPLVEWLRSLRLTLGDFEKTEAGINFIVQDLVCSGLGITGLPSSLATRVDGLQFSLKAEGISAACTGQFRYEAIHGVLTGSGGLSVQVQPGAGASISDAALQLSLPRAGAALPQNVELSSCDLRLDLSLSFSGSILTWILNLFSSWISSEVKSKVSEEVCGQLKDAAARNLTTLLSDLNHVMAPSTADAEPGPHTFAGKASHTDTMISSLSSRRLQGLAAAPETSASPQYRAATLQRPNLVDWTTVKSLGWTSWFLGDVLGPKGIDQALRWALKNATSLVLPVPAEPVFQQAFKQAGITLDISLYLAQMTVEGVESLAELLPLRAASPTELDVGFRFGTREQPALGVQVETRAVIKASDESGSKISKDVEERAQFHLALAAPSIGAQVRLMCDSEQWHRDRTLGQWYFAPAECARSLLVEAPEVKKLHVNFSGVAAPLVFSSETSGPLERDLASFLDRLVDAFNTVYEHYLPSAVSRIAGSPETLAIVNNELKTRLSPAECLGPEMAAARARELPRSFSSWSSIFSGRVRTAIDNTVDGFLDANDTRVVKGLKDMPKLSFGPFDAGIFKSDAVVGVKLSEVHFLGLDRVDKLRVLLPDPNRSGALAFRAEALCPSATAPWKPAVTSTGGILVNNDEAAGKVLMQPPCGNLHAIADVVLDVQRFLGLPALPSPLCLLEPLTTLAFRQADYSWGGGADLSVTSSGGSTQHPVQELCESLPDLCRIAETAMEKGAHLRSVNSAIDALRRIGRTSCSIGEHSMASFSATSASSPFGSTGGGRGPSARTSWICVGAVAATLALTGALTALASVEHRAAISRHSSGLDVGEMSPAARHISKDTWRAKSLGVWVSLTLSAAFVLRVLTIWFLPVASTTAHVHTERFGEMAQLELVSFDFWTLVQHYWEASAHVTAVLLVLSSFLTAFLNIFLLLFLWMTPVLGASRRPLMRMIIFLGRTPFIDVIFFSLALPVLNYEVKLPLGSSIRLREQLAAGVYAGILSIVCTVASCFFFLKEFPADAPLQPKGLARQRAELFLRLLGSIGLFVGLGLWLYAPFMHVRMAELAGAIIPPRSYSAGRLLVDILRGDPFLWLGFVSTTLLAPCAQALAMLLQAVGKCAPAANSIAWPLREFGDALTILDIYALAFFIAFVPEINGFGKWIVNAHFGAVCDASQQLMGMGCIGIDVSVLWAGILGLILAALCSLGASLAIIVAEVHALLSRRR